MNYVGEIIAGICSMGCGVIRVDNEFIPAPYVKSEHTNVLVLVERNFICSKMSLNIQDPPTRDFVKERISSGIRLLVKHL